jgi:hypothetical protein
MNQISDTMAQLKDAQNNTRDPFHNINELAFRKAEYLGTDSKQKRSVSKQTHRGNVTVSTICGRILLYIYLHAIEVLYHKPISFHFIEHSSDPYKPNAHWI